MQLSKVVLHSSNYDPASGKSSLQSARSEFDVSEGYSFRVDGSFVVISHGERSAGYPLGSVKYVIVQQPEPVAPVVAEAPVAVAASFKRKGGR